MTHILPITYDNIEAIAASAYSKSRGCITAIKQDVMHNVKHTKRLGFQRLIKAIEGRRIFTTQMLEELDVQINFLTHEVNKGTTEHEHQAEYDECNVSAPAYWTETHRTQTASELGRAAIMLSELNDTLLAVHDLMHAETALNELRLKV
jgi:hypothetical protein